MDIFVVPLQPLSFKLQLLFKKEKKIHLFAVVVIYYDLSYATTQYIT